MFFRVVVLLTYDICLIGGRYVGDDDSGHELSARFSKSHACTFRD